MFASGPQSRHNNLRVLLVADVLRRVLGTWTQATCSWNAPALNGRESRRPTSDGVAVRTRDVRYPSFHRVGDHVDAAAESLGQRRDVALGAGEVTALVPTQGRESLATRPTLPRHRRGKPVSRAQATLDQAEKTLREWRRGVAEWTEQRGGHSHTINQVTRAPCCRPGPSAGWAATRTSDTGG